MIYAVIDTNILVAALLSKHDDSATVQVIEHIFNGTITPIHSNQIIDEYRTVLQREKFKFPTEVQEHLTSAIVKFGLRVTPEDVKISLPDEKDLPFYAAYTCKSTYYLVTGNKKHFPQEEFIVSPREMIDILKLHNK